MSLFFVKALAEPARQYFMTHCSSHMPFGQIVSMMRRHYSSDDGKLQLQSEMDSLDPPLFMIKHNILDNSHGLSKLIDHINALAPQLATGFGNDLHKTCYLRRAVMSLDWTEQPIYQINTSKYSVIQFSTALQKSLQLKEERSRVKNLDLSYGQYVRYPRDVESQTTGAEIVLDRLSTVIKDLYHLTTETVKTDPGGIMDPKYLGN